MNISKKIFLPIFFITSLYASSQDFDPEFLESLPQSVKEDLLNQVEMDNALEQQQYRRPSTFIERPEIDSGRFGLNVFNMMQTSLMPVNEPNFDSGYILDFGDQIQIQLIGQKSYIKTLSINRDGSISIPDVGKVFLSGLSLDDASKLIKKKVEISYIGVEALVTLVNVRDIQIIVSGNVFNPGPYTLNGNSNVFHALSVSGGPSEDGSFRKINLIRGSEIIESIDLYETFIYGKPSFGTRLRSGDMIFVNPAENIVGIYGGVKRSGQYELKDDDSIEELIFFANGFSSYADINDIQIEEFINGKVQKRQISLETSKNEILKDGESLYVRSFPIREVSIKGAVRNPGNYKINEGDGILEVVKRAGGYTNSAYEFGGILINQDALEANKVAKDQLYRSFLSSIIENTAVIQSGSIESVGLLLQELKESPVSGRVSAEFNLTKLAEEPSLNTILKNGDEIIIPEKIDHIYIFGEVSNQGTSKYYSNKNIDFYIDSKGGLTEKADLNNIFVLYPNGQSKKIKRKNVFRDGNSEIDLYPGTIVFVPKKAENPFLSQTLQAYAVIVGNLGVSFASLAAIKD